MEPRNLILLIGLAAVVLVVIVWVAVRRRSKMHLCAICGKRVRASKGRCPECGTPIMFSLLRKAAKIPPK
jgi:predicted amidophosphoribosyltransferase